VLLDSRQPEGYSGEMKRADLPLNGHIPGAGNVYWMNTLESKESPVMEALKEAVRNKKKVTAYVEIKARFDELNNVRWAEELRKAGVKVVRPLGGFKVHSKLTEVIRREGGQDVYYAHLGTGNYHPGTALQYTDLGLLTNNQPVAREALTYFRTMMHRQEHAKFHEIMTAPINLHSGFMKLIDEETRIQKHGGKGHIIAKMNSLVDPDIIKALYAASQAGVKIELLVRGICCLRPGVKNLSENIRVVSIVDRFLEHSRIYYFRSGGMERVYLSSADWMPRNFYTRFEVAFPIVDPHIKKFVREVILETGLRDNTKSWDLKSDGHYERVVQQEDQPAVRSQFFFQDLAKRGYRGTVLEGRPRNTRSK
jgi:polyphosphate kinase